MSVSKLQRQFWENLFFEHRTRIRNDLSSLFIKNENPYVPDGIIALVRNGEVYSPQRISLGPRRTTREVITQYIDMMDIKDSY